jgi:hypothetical protein
MRIQKMTGLQFTQRINREFINNPNNWYPRGESPLDETGMHACGVLICQASQVITNRSDRLVD